MNTRDVLTNSDGLLTYNKDGKTHCLGYIFAHQDVAFCPGTGGWKGITTEELEAHNKALSQAEIKGLDENCQIGQGGTFFYKESPRSVVTWLGTVVSECISVKGISITFKRNGKTFRGRLQKDADCFNFKRVS